MSENVANRARRGQSSGAAKQRNNKTQSRIVVTPAQAAVPTLVTPTRTPSRAPKAQGGASGTSPPVVATPHSAISISSDLPEGAYQSPPITQREERRACQGPRHRRGRGRGKAKRAAEALAQQEAQRAADESELARARNMGRVKKEAIQQTGLGTPQPLITVDAVSPAGKKSHNRHPRHNRGSTSPVKMMEIEYELVIDAPKEPTKEETTKKLPFWVRATVGVVAAAMTAEQMLIRPAMVDLVWRFTGIYPLAY